MKICGSTVGFFLLSSFNYLHAKQPVYHTIIELTITKTSCDILVPFLL